MTEHFAKFETDERFPTGEWTGFWLQRPQYKSRQRMDLVLSFAAGRITGEGNDLIGRFIVRGRYDVATSKVVMHKSYIDQHDVLYEGWAELEKGIWGVWKIAQTGKDGFHIWPKGMKDPTQQELEAGVPEPATAEAKPAGVAE